MKSAASLTLLVLCLFSTSNCLPHEPIQHSEPLDCTPVDGWNLVDTISCWVYGEDLESYEVTIGTSFASNTVSQESDKFFEMLGEELGKIPMTCWPWMFIGLSSVGPRVEGGAD